ncbi:NnrS family protein [Shinella daejeonensis]|uniref:NnrS family protein n=1 Tax=Shinella daejeonensis TaxID=659017 RepID=UPI0020C820FA|nr:NnrS family protein [Shinella daejeonensis]MCP8896182.1 NnrS family protein [Shinella daejeonensis]
MKIIRDNGSAATARTPVPRGLKTTGPVLFSYGFRPFFLGAGLWGMVAMVFWLLALMTDLPIGGSYGAAYWHAHEMFFGFATAALAGFLLTAVPNWTGRLPVAGGPLMVLAGVWLMGRLALLQPDLLPPNVAVAVESLFLPFLLFICAREIVSGRKWKDLKVVFAILLLTAANLMFHYAVLSDGDTALAGRIAASAYLLLIGIIGGRIVPSFTRNWLNKRGETRFPTPANRYDTATLIVGAAALAGWVLLPDHQLTAALAGVAAIMHAVRLWRWRGWATAAEPLLLILHVAYAFLALGFLAIAAAAGGRLDPYSALHVVTIGAIGLMMLAVMGRATRGHTGRDLTASRVTSLSYACLVGAALSRPLAEVFPAHYHTLLGVSALLWIMAFGLFLLEYTPMLARVRRSPLAR